MFELKVGSLLLGAIREVTATELVINLPYNTSGTCTTQHTVDGVEVGSTPLKERFTRGELVACAVISNENGKVDVTLRPSIVNAGITLENIAQGMRIPGVVAGIEDHGFMLNIGIKEISKVFLKKRHVDAPENIKVGQILSVIVGSVNATSGLVTVFMVGENENGLTQKKLSPLEALKPGTIVEFTVKGDRAPGDVAKKVAGKEGANSNSFLPQLPSQRDAAKQAATALTEVTFNGRLQGVIDLIHKKVPSGSDFDQMNNIQDLSVNSKGRARILAVYPQTHEVHFTILPHIMMWKSASLPESLAVPGTIVACRATGYSGTKVARMVISTDSEEPSPSDEKCVGFVHISRCGSEKKPTIKEAISIGQKMKGRVMYANYLEGSVAVSTRPQDIEGSHFAINDVKVGQTIVGTVVKVQEKYLVVAVSETVAGLVNVEHVKDVPLKTMPSTFAEGMKAKFRVIDVDVEKRRLILTAKKTIATATDDELITGWDNVEDNKVSHGWLVGEKPFGLLIAFPGRVVGIIPKYALNSRKDKVEQLKKQGKGALVKVRVDRFDKEKKQLTLSFDLDGKSPFASLITAANNEPDLPTTKATDAEDEKVKNVRKATIKAGTVIPAPIYLTRVDDEAAYFSTVKSSAAAAEEGAVKRDAPEKSKKASEKAVTVVVPIGHLCDDAKQAIRAHHHLVKLAVSAKNEAQKFADALLATLAKKITTGKPSALALASSVDINGEEYVLGSLKAALVEYATNKQSTNKAALKWTDLSLYEMRVGYVQKVENFGIFVSFGKYSISALCQKRSISDEFIQSAEGLATIGDLTYCMVSSMSKSSQGLSKAERMAMLATPGEVSADMRPSIITKNVSASQIKEFRLAQAETALEVEKILLEFGEKKASAESVEKRGDVCREESAKSVGSAADRLAKSAGKARSAVIVQKSKSGSKLGLFVQILDSKVYAFVPATELDDHLGSTGAAVLDREEFAVGENITVKVVEDIKIANLVFSPEGSNAKVRPLICSARPSVVTDTITESTPSRPQTLTGLSVGDVFQSAVVSNAGPQGVFVSLSANVSGRVKLTELSRTKIAPTEVATRYPVGTALAELTVLSIDAEKKQVELSAKAASSDRLLKLEHLSEGAVIKARVKKALDGKGLLITVEDSDNVDVLVEASLLGDSKSVTLASFKKGALVKAVITKTTEERAWASLRPSDVEAADQENSDNEDSESEDVDMSGEGSDSDEDAEDFGSDGSDEEMDVEGLVGSDEEDESDDDEESSSEEEEVAPTKKAKVSKAEVDAAEAKLKSLKGSNKKEETPAAKGGLAALKAKAAEAASKNNKNSKSSNIDSSNSSKSNANNDNSDSDMDSDMEEAEEFDPLAALAADEALDGEETSGKSRLSKRAREASKRAEEARLRAAEERRLAASISGEEEPETIDDFERVLVSESNRSLIWMKYMAFHLKLSQLAAAREIAERAVKHGPIMTETEKMNVWVAYLNMECVFGSQQKFQEVFSRASQYCDKKDIYIQVIKVLEHNGKEQQAVDAAANATQKFSKEQDVWVRRFNLLYTLKRNTEARELLSKALAALPKRSHPAFTAEVARMEFKMGSTEHGQTLFEGLLSTYPKRTDLWSQFFDAMIGAYKNTGARGQESIRKVLEKATDLEGLKPKKMKFFFKRWLEFEASLGDSNEKYQELVRQKARTYIEKIESKIRAGVSDDDSSDDE